MVHSVLGHCSECGELWRTCQCPILRDSENSAVPVADDWADLQPAIDAARTAFPQPNEDEWMCVTHAQIRFMVNTAYNRGLERAAEIVCPDPHIEEERTCSEVAELIRAAKVTT